MRRDRGGEGRRDKKEGGGREGIGVRRGIGNGKEKGRRKEGGKEGRKEDDKGRRVRGLRTRRRPAIFL
jgi:hypothetical protein